LIHAAAGARMISAGFGRTLALAEQILHAEFFGNSSRLGDKLDKNRPNLGVPSRKLVKSSPTCGPFRP
jgi:hypothetical protein